MIDDTIDKLFEMYNVRYIPHDNWVKVYNNKYYYFSFNINYDYDDIIKVIITDDNKFNDDEFNIETYEELEDFLKKHFKSEYRMTKIKNIL
jgi:hypothetical protein